jgi:hypothetical protein
MGIIKLLTTPVRSIVRFPLFQLAVVVAVIKTARFPTSIFTGIKPASLCKSDCLIRRGCQ